MVKFSIYLNRHVFVMSYWGLFALLLDIITRLFSVIVATAEHHLYFFVLLLIWIINVSMIKTIVS